MSNVQGPATPFQSSMSQTLKSTASVGSADCTTTSGAPQNFKLLNEIYDDTEQIEIADDLLLFSVEEPRNFGEEIECKKAMKKQHLGTN